MALTGATRSPESVNDTDRGSLNHVSFESTADPSAEYVSSTSTDTLSSSTFAMVQMGTNTAQNRLKSWVAACLHRKSTQFAKMFAAAIWRSYLPILPPFADGVNLPPSSGSDLGPDATQTHKA